MYVDGEESPGLDIIEVSDTDPRAPKAETRTMIDVSKLEEVLEVWRKGVTQVKIQCGVNDRSKMVIGSVERCINDIEIVISLFAEKDGVK